MSDTTLTKGLGRPHTTSTIPEIAGKSVGVNYIIAIGIDRYEDPNKRLYSCEQDCEELIDVLSTEFGFQVYRKLYNEDATLAEIKKVFKDFGKEASPTDSLLIYYSGHGFLFQLDQPDGPPHDDDSSESCWVPFDCKEGDIEEYFPITQLSFNLRQLGKLQHILLISDSCYAGGALKHPAYFRIDTTADPAHTTYDEAPSRWAICSSRSNEPSLGGNSPGTTSLFTQVLLQQLKSVQLPNYLLTRLIADVESHFNGTSWPKPLFGRLQLIAKNSGQFIFKKKSEIIAIVKKRELLRTNFNHFDYSNQRSKIRQVASNYHTPLPKKQIVFFSGTPHCGLRYLIALTKKSGVFAISKLNPNYVNLSYVDPTHPDKMLEVFNNALGASIPKIDLVVKRLEDMLIRNSVIIVIEFEKGSFSNKVKKAWIDELAGFLDGIHTHDSTNGNRLALFVLDEDRFDYANSYENQNILGIQTTYMPFTIPVDVDLVADWYETMRQSYSSEIEEFDQLFDQPLRRDLDNIVRDTNGYPGAVMKRICEASYCDDLAEEIFNPK